MEESISPVTETLVERAVRPAAQTTPQLDQLASTTTTTETATASVLTQRDMVTTTTTMTAATAMHAPIAASVIPVEPMPSPVPGIPSPYHAVDFCVPVGPDFSLVTGMSVVSQYRAMLGPLLQCTRLSILDRPHVTE